jgi:SnoaL-like domain
VGVERPESPGKSFLAARGSLAGQISIDEDPDFTDEGAANPDTMSDAESVVRRDYAIVADLGSSVDDLRDVLHPEARITEHSNAISPNGNVRDLDAAVAGFEAGKRLLSAQDFEIHDLLVQGSRVAVKATWRGTLAKPAGPLWKGAELIAHVAALLSVENHQIKEHETFDCYEPLPLTGTAAD